MTKPREKTREELTAEIEESKKKIQQYENREKMLRQKLSREERRERIDTLYGWNKRAKDARLDLGAGTQTPDTAMSLTEEVQKLRQQTKEQAKEIARLKEENEFLAET